MASLPSSFSVNVEVVRVRSHYILNLNLGKLFTVEFYLGSRLQSCKTSFIEKGRKDHQEYITPRIFAHWGHQREYGSYHTSYSRTRASQMLKGKSYRQMLQKKNFFYLILSRNMIVKVSAAKLTLASEKCVTGETE